MNKLFKAEFFARNRRRLRAEHPGTPLVVTASGLLQRTNDTAFPFRQDSNFWYLTGIAEPDIILVIDEAGDYLIVPPRDETRKIFEGDIDRRAMSETSGIAEIFDYEAGWQRLIASLKQTGRAATLLPPPAYVDSHGLYTNPARVRLVSRLHAGVAGLKLDDIGPKLAGLRQVKQPPEIAAIKQAISITEAGLTEIKSRLGDYKFEYEIEADLSRLFRLSGAGGHAYRPIIAAGINACTLHYEANDRQLVDGSQLLLDVGAEVSNYAADLTRTWAIGQPGKRLRAVHQAVVSVQEQVIAALKPGLTPKAVEELATTATLEQLRRLELVGPGDKSAARRYFPHAVSHFLGLDTHDVGDYRQPLAAGMVLTVEPGIYIREEGLGVRIEDNVVITKTGCEVLSAGLSRSLE